MSKPQLQLIKKFFKKHLKKSLIETRRALCLSPILLAKKSRDNVKFCINYSKLNTLIKKDAYPILLIVKILAQLKKARIFTKINIWQIFHKLRIAANLEDLTTIATQFGAYNWKVIPFRLTNGPASWHRFINNVLWKYLNKFCMAYLDNILIYSHNLRKCKKHICLVLAKFWEFRIQTDVDKWEFHMTKTKYLCLVISIENIKIDPAKVKAI